MLPPRCHPGPGWADPRRMRTCRCRPAADAADFLNHPWCLLYRMIITTYGGKGASTIYHKSRLRPIPYQLGMMDRVGQGPGAEQRGGQGGQPAPILFQPGRPWMSSRGSRLTVMIWPGEGGFAFFEKFCYGCNGSHIRMLAHRLMQITGWKNAELYPR